MKKMKTKWLIPLLCMLVLIFLAPSAMAAPPAHQSITSFEGPKTCKTCHVNAAQEVANSLHYHQCGPAPFVKDIPKGQCAGQMATF